MLLHGYALHGGLFAPPLPALEFMDTAPFLNLYGYPDEADYERSLPLDQTWHNYQTSVRTSEPWELPRELMDAPGPLVLEFTKPRV